MASAVKRSIRDLVNAGVLSVSLSLSLASAQSLSAAAAPWVARFEGVEYQGQDAVLQNTSSATHFSNPILAGWHSDPSIVAVGDDFYLITSTFAYFPGIPVYHSKDLVNWAQIGNAIDRSSQFDFRDIEISRGIFAASISYHQGIFYIASTCVDCGGNFLLTARNPAGPWSDPIWLPRVGGIDPSLFFDHDGKAYIVHNGEAPGKPMYDGHRALWIHEYDVQAQQTVGEPRLLIDGGVEIKKRPIWIEGPHIIRHKAWYYLIAAEGGTAEDHSQVVFRAKSVLGPYEPAPRNPILTQRDLPSDRAHPITSAGHADLVQLSNGDWWAVFLATRPYSGNFYNTGRETYLLPVDWSGEWPVILPQGQAIAFSVKRPVLTVQPAAALPHAGNFTQREEFNSEHLPLQWLSIRNPNGAWFRLRNRALEMLPNPVQIGEQLPQQVAFLGRRQQHASMRISTSMQWQPQAAYTEAGLVAFQNHNHWYFFGMVQDKGMSELRVASRASGLEEPQGTVMARKALSLAQGQSIALRIIARGAVYDFDYSLDGKTWQSMLNDADGTILSTRKAGGFVGTMIGPYAASLD